MTTIAPAYAWDHDWAEAPGDPEAAQGWAHHGMTVASSGDVIAYHPGSPALLIYGPDGQLKDQRPVPVFEAHDLVAVTSGGTDHVWIADIGLKAVREPNGTYRIDAADGGGQAVRVRLDGTLAQRLPTPPIDAYLDRRYCPASIAVDEERFGGTGDVWVADAYGESLVHRFDRFGTYLSTIRGDEADGPGRLDCPHGLVIDRRSDQPLLYVADRANARLLVYTLEGEYLRTVGTGDVVSPSAFALSGDLLVVAEHRGARLTLFDREDRLVGYVGRNDDAQKRPGWPNALDSDGSSIAPPETPELFNSPHGVAAGDQGELYVGEWLIGGRLTRLRPA